MSVISIPIELDSSLAEALDQHLSAGNHSLALSTIKDNKYVSSLQNNCSDTVAVILKHLTDINFIDNPKIFDTAECLLKSIAEIINPEEALFEFLEIIETTKSDNIFTSTLKALQICLQRQNDNKSRSLEWCLNSIQTYVQNLPLADETKNNIDELAIKLLEENDQIRRILSNYLTLFLFYEPILKDICDKNRQHEIVHFRDVRITRKNVLASFILQLFGAPLCYLDLSPKKESNTNMYSRQCVTSLVQHFLTLFPDPMFMLGYIEKRIRWPIVRIRGKKSGSEDDGDDQPIYEMSSQDFFVMEEKLPLDAVLVFFYAIFVAELTDISYPCVYRPLYLFESSLYVITEIFRTRKENALHYKAIQLALTMLKRLENDEMIRMEHFDLDVHEIFCNEMIKMIVESTVQENSQTAALLLKQYANQFEMSTRQWLIKKFFHLAQKYSALTGYLISLYKNILAEILDSSTKSSPIKLYTNDFHLILSNYIFYLPNGCETDIIQNADHIISALNFLRYIAVRDQGNHTGFWDNIKWIQENYLNLLQIDIDMSRSHYMLEQKQQMDKKNDGDDYRMQIMANALNTFDLISSLMSRVDECLRIGSEKI